MTISNTNFLTNVGFNVIIQKLPTVTFFSKSVRLPGISVNNPSHGTPFTKYPLPADTATFGVLSVSFNVDEDLANWKELYAWMVGMTFPESHDQWKSFIGTTSGSFSPGNENNVYSDITVQTLTSAKNPNKQFVYHNCIVRSVSDIDLTNASNSTDPIICTAEFDFSHFTLENI